MNSSFIQMDSVEYCYENVTKSCIKLSRSVGERAALYFVCVVTVLITVGGNLVVIISISHFKQLHSPNNLLVLTLAIADFLLGIFKNIRKFTNERRPFDPSCSFEWFECCWYMGSFYCNLELCFEALFSNTSVKVMSAQDFPGSSSFASLLDCEECDVCKKTSSFCWEIELLCNAETLAFRTYSNWDPARVHVPEWERQQLLHPLWSSPGQKGQTKSPLQAGNVQWPHTAQQRGREEEERGLSIPSVLLSCARSEYSGQ
ncbi:TAAR9 protein, partial [Amia calva]|nr:TAAR9 protein [Amia calva]